MKESRQSPEDIKNEWNNFATSTAHIANASFMHCICTQYERVGE